MADQVVPTEQTMVPEELHAALQERLATGTLDVPMLPDVVLQIMNLTFSERTDTRQLADLIHRDQALASHILRVANSPAYKPQTPIVSLQQAITRFGIYMQLGQHGMRVYTGRIELLRLHEMLSQMVG